MTTPAVGDELAPLERRITLVDMVAYAGATWDWYRLHYDSEFVQAAQLPAPLVDGQVLGAYLAEQVLDALGPTTFLRSLRFRFRSMVFAGDTVTVTGRVTAAEQTGDGMLVTVEQRIGVGERAAVEGATAVAVVR